MTFVSILPPNSTPLERALEASFAARLDALSVPVGQMMNPATCPAAFLPWLAWALSVDEWSPEWTEETQRAAIAASIGVHRRKGTPAALRAAIAAAGYGEVQVVERYALPRRDGTRRYNGGNDNYARGAADVGNPVFWVASVSSNGVTATRIASGIDTDGLPYNDWTITGTATGNSLLLPYTVQTSPAATGETRTASISVQVIAGAAPTAATTGFRLDVIGSTASTVDAEVSFSSVFRPLVPTIITRAATFATAGIIAARTRLVFRTDAGVTVNYTVRLKGLQFEVGAARTQLVFAPLIHGSPDHWAEYRLNIARPVTIAQAQQIRRIAAGVAPARCHLKEITYQAAQHLHNGAIARDGTFTRGSA